MEKERKTKLRAPEPIKRNEEQGYQKSYGNTQKHRI
jgi:hypothetical protein